VVVETLQSVMIVPTPAVRRGPIGTFVYAIDGDTARLRKIEVVTQDDVRAVIKGDIAPDTRVVTVGFAQLADGKQVRVVAPGEEGNPQPPQAGAENTPRKERGNGEGRKGDGQKRKNADTERRREATQ
jgi:multidrug efflux system membrane fusion protein